jgi:hypothetical protein
LHNDATWTGRASLGEVSRAAGTILDEQFNFKALDMD